MKNKFKEINKKTLIILVLVSFLILGSISFGGYFYLQYKKVELNSNKITQQEVSSLISSLSNIYIFPNGEQPNVAKISNKELLKDQSFFSNAMDNDIVFLFELTGKIVLYRPSINKIIDISIIKNESNDSNQSLDSKINSLKDINF